MDSSPTPDERAAGRAGLQPLAGAVLCRFAGERSQLSPGSPWIATLAAPALGSETEELIPPVANDVQVGVELVDLARPGTDLEQATEAAYTRVLERTGSGHLCRIWNYVPHINVEERGLERYRAFCRGRARAFEARWGAGFERRLPAGSAVGGPADALAVIYAVCEHEPEPVENPEQVPAYAYPPEHGPRSPSFSRATRARGRQYDWIFVSGTASIKGHQTIHTAQLRPQIVTTLHNLELVSSACGVGRDLGASAGWQRHFKVYLRHARDLEAARTDVEPALLRSGDSVVWLQADICRSDLEVEIEATLWRRR